MQIPNAWKPAVLALILIMMVLLGVQKIQHSEAPSSTTCSEQEQQWAGTYSGCIFERDGKFSTRVEVNIACENGKLIGHGYTHRAGSFKATYRTFREELRGEYEYLARENRGFVTHVRLPGGTLEGEFLSAWGTHSDGGWSGGRISLTKGVPPVDEGDRRACTKPVVEHEKSGSLQPEEDRGEPNLKRDLVVRSLR